jgi:hypothetical protein
MSRPVWRGRVSTKDANMATSVRLPGRSGAVPAARGGLDPADPWLRIDGHGVSGLPAAGLPANRTAAPVKWPRWAPGARRERDGYDSKHR